MILEISNLTKDFVTGRSLLGRGTTFRALDNVSLSLAKGETCGVVGESGSGKSTLARCVMGLETPTSGSVRFDGADVGQLPRRDLQRLRSRLQIVFQDPYASLNPRMTVHDIVTEPMEIYARSLGLTSRQRTERAVQLLERVGLRTEHLTRYPHEFSGGQRQRIGIARALAVQPELLVLDEPTSALDVSVQAEVLNLLIELQREFHLTYLFISHDLAVVRYLCDRVVLMKQGSVVEEGTIDAIFDAPQTKYARALVGAMPVPDPDLSPYRPAA